ncbi:MAG: hypothetical protein Q8J90_01735 [Gallionella sp.]|nr:hypothetical protein [Gallionella sp.]
MKTFNNRREQFGLQGAAQRATRHTIKVGEAASEHATPQIERAAGYWRFL